MIALRRQISAASSGAYRSGPGVALCCAIGIGAMTMAMVAGSGVVWALIIGMTLAAAVAVHPVFAAGVETTSTHILRLGVALLGAQISAATLTVLDVTTIAALAGCVLVIVVAGRLLAPVLGIDPRLALIAAGSVAICGASAAVAFALVLVRGETHERDVGCTVGAVSILSMLAMLIYPLLARMLSFDPITAGVFFGATIQEVAHAVGAGYAVGEVTGTVATMTKLLRVAMLGPVLMLVIAARAGIGMQADLAILRPPMFLIGFVALAVLNVSGALPPIVGDWAGALSRYFIIIAMAAIGLKMQWRGLAAYGWRPVLLLLSLSALLAVMVAVFLINGRPQ